MKKVLVIGGSGFIGRHLVHELAVQGFMVYVMVHRNPVPSANEINPIRGGISAVDRKLIDRLGPDVVFHVARPSFPLLRKPGRMLSARYAEYLNRRLLHEIESSQRKPDVVFASGSLMYGPTPMPVYEDQPLHPYSFARQYYRGELPLLDALHQSRVNVKIIRFPWLLGKGSWFEWFYMEPVRKYGTIPLYGAGNNKMEIIDISDAMKLTVRIADEDFKYEICNLVTSGAITQLEFASTLQTVLTLPVVDYREFFKRKPEKEAIQAFSSSIELATRHQDLFSGFQYTPLEATLRQITG